MSKVFVSSESLFGDFHALFLSFSASYPVYRNSSLFFPVSFFWSGEIGWDGPRIGGGVENASRFSDWCQRLGMKH
jgi:hypothetical protein